MYAPGRFRQQVGRPPTRADKQANLPPDAKLASDDDRRKGPAEPVQGRVVEGSRRDRRFHRFGGGARHLRAAEDPRHRLRQGGGWQPASRTAGGVRAADRHEPGQGPVRAVREGAQRGGAGAAQHPGGALAQGEQPDRPCRPGRSSALERHRTSRHRSADAAAAAVRAPCSTCSPGLPGSPTFRAESRRWTSSSDSRSTRRSQRCKPRSR